MLCKFVLEKYNNFKSYMLYKLVLEKYNNFKCSMSYKFVLEKYIYFKSRMLSLIYFCLIKYIDFDSYMSAILMKYLPDFIPIKTFIYYSNSSDNINFEINEYKCNFNQKFYIVRFIDEINKMEIMYNFNKNINKNIKDRNLIYHASLQKNGIYIRDVTEDLRSYFHYVEFNGGNSRDLILKLRESYMWKYIKYNIGLLNNYELLISLNDDNMTDLVFTN